MFDRPALGYWREGKRLVMDRNAPLPDRCVKCNEPAEGYRRKIELSWASRKAMFFAGELSMVFARRATIDVPLCTSHRRNRSRAVNAFLAAGVALLAAFYFIGLHQSGPATALIIAACAAGAYGIWKLYLIRAAKMDEVHLWIAGCGEPFLASLPLEPSELPAGAVQPPSPAEVSREAYRYARNGAVTFAAGSAITAGTYLVAPGGRYYIVWGLVLIGLLQLGRGVRAYLRVPASERQGMQVATLGGIVLAGMLALGWVGASVVQASAWDGALDQAAGSITEGSKLFNEIAARPGTWTAGDAADMARVAGYYGAAADVLAGVVPPADMAWYRDGMVANLREGQDIASQLSKLTAASPTATFQGLGNRWAARVAAFKALQDKVESRTR